MEIVLGLLNLYAVPTNLVNILFKNCIVKHKDQEIRLKFNIVFRSIWKWCVVILSVP